MTFFRLMSTRNLQILASDVLIGGTLCGAGDLAAQVIAENDGSELNTRRLGSMVSYGSLAAIPYHAWYKFLAIRFPSATATKTLLECLLVLPFFEIPAVILWTGVVGRQQNLEEAVNQLRSDFWPAFGYGCCLWGPTSSLTFHYIHPRWHLTTFYLIGACWDFSISNLSFDGGPFAVLSS
uniref:Uncharacterized protein n=1 Tax=Aureoumbra lagunensis TaxID=44058 RepID=A0A7S3NHL1_9STRA|mmetsp:Transcript_1099/g.1368  ORF Transcript_1099/g.1368 Transcript_1099/m.1368 type:complete len:180 (-) Transcript_1099:105-644(-)